MHVLYVPLAKTPSNVGQFSASVVKTPFQVAGLYLEAFSSLSYFRYIKLYSLITTQKVSVNYTSHTVEEIVLIQEAVSDGIFSQFLDRKIIFYFPG